MAEYPVAFYRAFSETVFGGSMAGIIAQAQNLPAGQMLQIAQEIGAPATGSSTAARPARRSAHVLPNDSLGVEG